MYIGDSFGQVCERLFTVTFLVLYATDKSPLLGGTVHALDLEPPAAADGDDDDGASYAAVANTTVPDRHSYDRLSGNNASTLQDSDIPQPPNSDSIIGGGDDVRYNFSSSLDDAYDGSNSSSSRTTTTIAANATTVKTPLQPSPRAPAAERYGHRVDATIILVLSIVVVLAFLFIIFGLFVKAEAHIKQSSRRSAHGGHGGAGGLIGDHQQNGPEFAFTHAFFDDL